ncbi:MAG TPA: helix-turn-helix transcriptional regulator [Candidatus Limnocylindrales bacterium]|nr:helix-turn-helix transcriptional regulator [Candidatus Limnocylindrales bacterium]
MTGPQIGRIARVLRHRLRLTQDDVAGRARTSQSTVSLLERGHVDRVAMPTVRRILGVLEADVVVSIRWRAGDLDRVIDERHAAIGEVVTTLLVALGWEAIPEVTYSISGERGSIDILAWHAPTRTLLVIEVKSEVTSIEETLRRHDAKVRLAPRVAAERLGWRAVLVARLLVLPETSTARRQVDRHARLFARAYPERNRSVRAFLRDPRSRVRTSFGGLMFLSSSDGTSPMRLTGPSRRVRHAQSDSRRA